MLPKADDEHIVAHVTALSEFALYCPDQFEEKSETIVKFLVQDLIYRPADKVNIIPRKLLAY
jgi:sister-chromatid-cohesion protein PDS5